jgi:prevent-host-death family protein
MREMKAGEFKAKCMAVMDEVAATGEPVVITKRGKPVARLVPAAKDQTGLLAYLKGTGKIVDPNDDLIETFTPDEIAEFEQHLMEEADEFLTPPPSKGGGGRGQ